MKTLDITSNGKKLCDFVTEKTQELTYDINGRFEFQN